MVAIASFCCSAVSGQSSRILDPWKTTEARQFDFWIGKWDVNLRMIQKDLSWRDSVKATVEIYPILDGKAILELWDSKPIKGFSLRYYDPSEKKWILYLNWPNRHQSSIGSLKGTFRHGRGEFFSTSRGVISRYSFSDITANSLRWDDAFSRDGGKTWTHNWIMEFSRTGKTATFPAGDRAHTFADGSRCPSENARVLNSLGGKWKGKLTFGAGEKRQSVDATLRVYNVLGGCSVIQFLEYNRDGKIHREFGLVTYNPQAKRYEELWLNNQAGSVAEVYRGDLKDQTLALTARHKTNSREILKRHQWMLPKKDSNQLRLVVSSKTTDDWEQSAKGKFLRSESVKPADKTEKKLAINRVCPRSGKPVAADSLTRYREVTVGFCNQHCRDDFAANVESRSKDRAFFDKLIDAKKQ